MEANSLWGALSGAREPCEEACPGRKVDIERGGPWSENITANRALSDQRLSLQERVGRGRPNSSRITERSVAEPEAETGRLTASQEAGHCDGRAAGSWVAVRVPTLAPRSWQRAGPAGPEGPHPGFLICDWAEAVRVDETVYVRP